MISIQLSDNKLEYPGFYNIYPVFHETSGVSELTTFLKTDSKNSEFVLDENYGRLLNKQIKYPYGKSDFKTAYIKQDGLKPVSYLRVPFRKIPIFNDLELPKILELIKQIEIDHADYEILLRGQTEIYSIKRTNEEIEFLYGDSQYKEPSFQPSFLRTNFNENFIKSLWFNQCASMLHDVGIDLKKVLNREQLEIYYNDVENIKNSHHLTPIALGFAQHYGLPSIGLDLTKDPKVALWFASHKMDINSETGHCKLLSLEDFKESTMFIFRCPKDTVFSHGKLKPKFIENTRPDKQDAWFCHCGWGLSKNQLASYLVCGIRLNSNILNEFEDDYGASLFPSRKQDFVLDYFLNMRERKENVNEVKRALKKIYFTDE